MSSSSPSSITPIVQWYEGMMLLPQHLQQMEIRNHQNLVHQINLVSSYHWGICDVQWDQITLAEGMVRITHLDAVLPDGTIISFSPQTAEEHPLEIDLQTMKDEWPEAGISLFICLKGRVPGVSPLLGDHPRFISIDGPDVMDENIGGSTVKIPRLYPNIFLHAGNPLPSNCYAFPLMHILWKDGVFTVTDYTPPRFFFKKNGFLWKQCSNLALTIRSKVGFLCDRWQNQVGTPLAFETESLLRPLMTALPAFELMLSNNTVHPAVLYQHLAHMVGELSTLKLDQPPPIISPYQHNDLNKCFLEVIHYLEQYVKCIEMRFAIIPFTHKERLFSLRMHPPYSLNQSLYVGLRMAAPLPEVEEWVRTCIIASGTQIENVQKLRITGVKRRMLSNEELYALMPGRGVVAFVLNVPDPFLSMNEALHIFHPGDSTQPTELILFVPNYPRQTDVGAA